MVSFAPWMPAAVILSGIVSACVLWFFFRQLAVSRSLKTNADETPYDSFLFRNGKMVDHTLRDIDTRTEFLESLTTWSEFKMWLGNRFSDLPEHLSTLQTGQSKTCPAQIEQDIATVTISSVRDGHLVRFCDPLVPRAAEWHDALRRKEIEAVRLKGVEDAPSAMCEVDQLGLVVWRNTAFQQFTETEASHILEAVNQSGGCLNHPVTIDDGKGTTPRHFELRTILEQGRRIVFATDVTRLVQGDMVRGAFIQTLTKTFAELATGLAVFDRQRQLVLFNPAIVDLTGLSAEFLSGRPNLMEFFDRLRDKQVLPEPKNYANWRAHLSEVISSASDGNYAEAWSLPNGLTYRVTGRPHPDGAVAFLIEDISDEISLSRRARSQLEIRQAVLDRVSEAIAVIGPNGLVAFCNKTFRDLLRFDPDSGFTETSFEDLLSICSTVLPDSPYWRQLAKEVSGGGKWTASCAVLEGSSIGKLRCRVEPLPGGFAMMSLARAEKPLLVLP